MRVRLKVCDICKASGIVRLARGAYITDEGKMFDACSTHYREVRQYEGFSVRKYDKRGDADPELFHE